MALLPPRGFTLTELRNAPARDHRLLGRFTVLMLQGGLKPLLKECIGVFASTWIWAGLGEHLSQLSRPNNVHSRNGCNHMQELGLYLAAASSSDKTPLRYNVSNFLNSATTRTLPVESASPYSVIMPLTIWRDRFAASRDRSFESDGFFA